MAGTEIPGGGGRGRLYPTLHCHHQNDSCIKMGDYTYRYTVTTRMTPALRWATMREISCFINCEGHNQQTIHRPKPLKRRDSRSGIEPRSLSLPALPLGQTGSHTPHPPAPPLPLSPTVLASAANNLSSLDGRQPGPQDTHRLQTTT